MLVIQHLSQRVSEGAAVANAIELAVVNGSGPESLDGKFAVVPSATLQLSQSGPDDTTGDPVSGQSARGVEEEKFSALRLANASIVIALALLTKNLLLDVYSLTEEYVELFLVLTVQQVPYFCGWQEVDRWRPCGDEEIPQPDPTRLFPTPDGARSRDSRRLYFAAGDGE